MFDTCLLVPLAHAWPAVASIHCEALRLGVALSRCPNKAQAPNLHREFVVLLAEQAAMWTMPSVAFIRIFPEDVG